MKTQKRLLSLMLVVALMTILFGAMTTTVTGSAQEPTYFRVDVGEFYYAVITDNNELKLSGFSFVFGLDRQYYGSFEDNTPFDQDVVSISNGRYLKTDGSLWELTDFATKYCIEKSGVVEVGPGYYIMDDGTIVGNYQLRPQIDPDVVPPAGKMVAFSKAAEVNGYPFELHSGTATWAIAVCTDGSVWTQGSYEIEMHDQYDYDENGNWVVTWQDETINPIETDWYERTITVTPPVSTNKVVRDISTSIYTNPHTMSIVNNTLYGAGHGTDGQLGWGFFGSAYSPAMAETAPYGTIENVQKVSAGNRFTLALKSDGTVWASGYNEEYGTLGNGNKENQKRFVQVQGLTNVIDIAAGKRHSLALKADGTVWAWGSSSNGQLGQGNRVPCMTPVQVKSPDGSGYLNNIRKISAGSDASYAITNDHKLYAWGNNYHGQLGDGTTIEQLRPELINIQNVKDIVAAQDFVIAVMNDSDGSLMSWGRDTYGCLGQYSVLDTTAVQPGYVMKGYNSKLTGIVSVSAGADHCAAIDKYGKLWVWGRNNAGQLGEGGTAPRNYAAHAKNINGDGDLCDVMKVSCGKWYTMAVLTDGTVLGFGSNERGQLGVGTMGGANRLLPVVTQF